MHWLIASIIFLLVFQPLDLQKLLAPAVRPLHSGCLSRAPDSPFRPWYQAIVCGENLPPSPEKLWFQRSGLIHVIVVSGSHLIFLDEILLLLPGSSIPVALFRWSVLLLFSLMTNLQPPIARALIQRALTWFFITTRRPLTRLHLQLISGIVTVSLFPQWWTSLSFIMSWVCALALGLPLPSKSPLARAGLIYLLMLPVMWNIQIPQPGQIFFNLLLGPLFALVLFPMSLLGFLHSLLTLLSDWGWRLTFFLFSHMPLPETETAGTFANIWLIFYIVALQAGSLFMLIRRRRQLWHAC